jgi:hypothetical protein
MLTDREKALALARESVKRYCEDCKKTCLDVPAGGLFSCGTFVASQFLSLDAEHEKLKEQYEDIKGALEECEQCARAYSMEVER